MKRYHLFPNRIVYSIGTSLMTAFLRFLGILTLPITLVMAFSIQAKSQCFAVDFSLNMTNPLDCAQFFDEEMAYYYPEGVIYLNFHFILDSVGGGNFGPTGDNNGNANDEENSGLHIANEILYRLNQLTEELIEPQVDVNDNAGYPSQRKMPWRFELYTESSKTSDIYDGIWFWNHSNYYDDLMVTHGPDIDAYLIRPYGEQQGYGNQVLDVYLVEIDGPGQGGWAPETSALGRGIFLFNTWKHYNMRMDSMLYSDHWFQGYVLNHEIGHMMTGDGGHVNDSTYDCDDALSGDTLTNNVMHSAVLPWRVAWTPCQMNLMYENFQHSPTREYYIPANPCTLTSSPLVIDTVAVFQTQITFDRDIVVEDSGSLTINCLVNMPPNGKIKIKPGGEVFLATGSKITSGCEDQLWGGILVFGNRNTYNAPQARILSESNSILENAKIAISNPWVDHYSSIFMGSLGGDGFLALEGTTFLNNETSIKLYPYTLPSISGGTIQGYPGKFLTCSFVTDTNYFSNVNPIQAKLTGVNGPSFTNCKFVNERTQVETLTSLGVGVASWYSAPKFFYRDSPGLPVTPRPLFQGYHRGIFAVGGGTTYVPTINGHDFKKNVVGATFLGIDLFSVVNCKFEIGNLVMPYNTEGNDYHEGISVLTGAEFEIRNNEFIGITNPPDPGGQFDDPHKFGLRILNSGMSTTEVNNNEYDNLRIANKAEGLNRNPLNNSEGLSFKCNDNVNEVFDFTVIPIKPEDGILQNQGASINAAKNTFTNLSDSVSVGTDFYNQSTWAIHYWWTDEAFQEPLNYFSFKTFAPRPATTPGPTCGTIGIVTGDGGLVYTDSIGDLFILYTDLYDSLIDIRTNLIDGNATSNWITKVNTSTTQEKATLMSQLAALSPYTSDVLLEAIFNRTNYFTNSDITTILNQNIHFYQYPYLREMLKEDWSQTDSSMAVIFNNSPSDLIKLESELSEASIQRFLQSQELIRFYQEDSIDLNFVNTWTSEIENIERDYIRVGQAIAVKEFEEALEILDDIQSAYNFSTRMDSIHDQYVIWTELMSNLDQVTEDSIFIWLGENESTLVELAENTITKPAAWARGLLYLLDSAYDYYWYPIGIDELIEPRSDNSISQAINIYAWVYPNPSSDEISIFKSINNDEEVIATIVDLSGKLVSSYKLRAGLNHNFDISHLPGGIYCLSILNKEGVQSFKFLKLD